MATLAKLTMSAWSIRPRKPATKPQTKKKRKKRKTVVSCKLERAFKILGDNVFTEKDCPDGIRKTPENVDMSVFGKKTIDVEASRLRLARRTVGLFYIPSGLSVASMQKAYPEMFGDLRGLIPEIYDLESDEPNPWNWFIVSQLPTAKPPKVLLLIETVYVHIVHRIKTGKNFFKGRAVVCDAEEDRSRVVVFFNEGDGRISIPAGNFLEEQNYAVGRQLR